MSGSQETSLGSKLAAAIGVCALVVFGMVIVVPYFVRARYEMSANACVNNLRQIAGAKEEWALENKKQASDIPTSAEIAVYLGGNKLPICPAGGTYTMRRVGEDPRCSIEASAWPNSHILNETNKCWLNCKCSYGLLFGLRKAPPSPN